MSDSTPRQDPLENGMDDGTGDPDADRTYLQDQPPAQVDDDAVREHREDTADSGE